MSRGFRRCTIQIYQEHEAKARAELAKHEAVIAPETIDYSGQHLSFSIDLATIPNGHGALVEAVIVMAIEKATKP
jgi:hypothetical protein